MSNDPRQQVLNTFETVAASYDNPATRFFHCCGDRLISKLNPGTGSQILDVATGTGAVALPAALAVAPHGRVQAIDLSNAMLDRALHNLQKAGISNIDFHVMDGEHLEFKHDYFDYVTCSFGLFFFNDMQSGLKEWLRVMKPGGQIMLTSFNESAFRPLADIFKRDMAEYGIEIPQEKWRHLTNRDDCQALLESAGFNEISIEAEQMGYHLETVDNWWQLLYSTGFRGFIDQLSPQQLEEFQQQHKQRIAEQASDQGIWLDVDTLFICARKPS